MPRSFWWKYNLHYVYNLYATGIRFIYMNGCRHTFYVISFDKATHHFIPMPYQSIYNRNLYYVLNGCCYCYCFVYIYTMDIQNTKLTRNSNISIGTYIFCTAHIYFTWNTTLESSGNVQIKYTRVRGFNV